MPHISVSLYHGRTEEAKAEMAKKLNQCLVGACGWRPEDISVSFAEFSADHFVNEVTQKIASEELLMASDYIKE